MENDITGVSDIPKDRENAINMEKDSIILSLKQENEKILAELHALRNQVQTLEFFKTAADYFPHVIAIYDTERKFVFVNSYAMELSGLAYNDYIGRRDEDIFPPSVTRCYLPVLQKAIETLKPQTKECTIKFKTKRTLILTFIPMLNEGGAALQCNEQFF